MSGVDISVVICTHNRATSLRDTLAGLEAVDVPFGLAWEVLVVDNASSDNTRATVERFHKGSALPLRYRYVGTPGLSRARNAGIEASRGDIVAFIDDDVRVRADWLAAVARAFQDHPEVACVGGRVFLAAEIPRPPWWRKEYDGYVGEFDRGDEPRVVEGADGAMVGIGANLSFRRRAFEQCGTFRHDLGRRGNSLLMGEEIELIERIRRAGRKTLYYPPAVVYHLPGEERFRKSYLRRWFRGQGEWHCLRERDTWDDSVRILGVPRWHYRSAARAFVSYLWHWLKLDGASAFKAELQVRRFWGYLSAARHQSASVS